MKIKIMSIEPTDDGKIRLYYSVDGRDNELKSMLLEETDLDNINKVKQKVQRMLKGYQHVGQVFEL